MIVLDDETLSELTSYVFGQMLSMPVDKSDTPCAADGVHDYVASIEIRGEDSVDLAVRLSKETATAIASRMFQSEADQVIEEDVLDAVGEIANMIGGNIKGMSDIGNNLSLPTVRKNVSDEVAGNSHHLLVGGLPLTIHWSTGN